MLPVVRDHIPLEQGLRQPWTLIFTNANPRQRPYSIRTRIKTGHARCCPNPPHQVRDHIPLEQGLRPKSKKIFLYHLRVRDHIPLEQGLRLE